MILRLLVVGRTNENWLKEGEAVYAKRLPHYVQFEYVEIPDLKIPKGTNNAEVKRLEGIEILKRIDSGAYLVLLDEQGKSFSSVQFSEFLQKRFNSGMKSLVFLIGGPYGFSEEIYARANEKMSLSKMTFSHQMVRVFALEQIYRALTILKHEPYHHS